MMKMHIQVFSFQISSRSNSPSSSSSSSFECSFISINSTRLQGDLQPISGSLGQLLLTNIYFSKFLKP